MKQTLVMLVGAPRSGTTWLQLMLAQSPRIATCNETHLFSSYLRSMLNYWSVYQTDARSVGLHHLLGQDEFDGLCRTVCDDVFARIAARNPSAQILLEKTPAHVSSWSDIRRLYPDARFIHLVRDPRAVVSSLKAASRTWGTSWAPAGCVSGAQRWASDVHCGSRITAPVITVTYEDLKADAPAELIRLLEFMGVPATLEDCQSYAEGRATDEKPWDTTAEPSGFVRRAYNDWSELSRSEVAVIEHVARSTMTQVGYEATARKWRGWVRFKCFQALDGLSRYLNWCAKRI